MYHRTRQSRLQFGFFTTLGLSDLTEQVKRLIFAPYSSVEWMRASPVPVFRMAAERSTAPEGMAQARRVLEAGLFSQAALSNAQKTNSRFRHPVRFVFPVIH